MARGIIICKEWDLMMMIQAYNPYNKYSDVCFLQYLDVVERASSWILVVGVVKI
jgi:hypothetical protein